MFNPGLPKDGWAPVQTFKCNTCGHINKDMDPKETLLYSEDDEKGEQV